MLALVKASTRPSRVGRPPRAPEVVREEVEELTSLVRTSSPSHVARWLRQHVNRQLDEELEVLATYVLSEMELPSTFPEVRGPLYRGDFDGGLDAMVSRLRRRFAKLLRDHQRAEDDDFYDSCTVE